MENNMKKFNEICNKIILESSISKIMNYVKNFECATISASRGKLTNLTDNAFVPEDYADERALTEDENRKRNTELKAKLLKLGYGVTSLDGRFAEAGEMFPGKETSYFVVNRNEDPEFFNNIFALSEYFNQDSFLYKPAGSMSAKLIGTNNAERNEDWGQPGYNGEIEVGDFHPNGFEGALSKMGNKVFQFRLNENKEQNEKFMADKILCEEIFENLSIQTKSAVTKTAKRIKGI
jgi:hypothetical protein